MKLGVQVGLGLGHNVLDGDPGLPPPKGHSHSPNFRPISLSVVAKWLDGSRCHLVGREASTKRHRVRWGPSFSSPKRGQSTQFSAHVYCGQTAAWIKMPRGMEAGFGPGYIVLDGDPVPPPKKGHSPPEFRPMFVVAKRLDGSRCHFVRW